MSPSVQAERGPKALRTGVPVVLVSTLAIVRFSGWSSVALEGT